MSLGPLDLYGPEFLMLYGLMLVATALFSLMMPALLRPAGREQSVTDPDQIALLSGGATRIAESAVTRLMTADKITVGRGDTFQIERGATAAGAVEGGIIALRSPAQWSEIEGAVKLHVGLLQSRMVRADLMLGDDLVHQLRWRQSLPLLLLGGFGTVKLLIGIARDRPVGILTVLLVITGILAVMRYVIVDRRTEAAIKAVDNSKANSRRLRTAPTRPEMGMAVALFGTAVLAGSYYDSLHKLRQSSGDGGSSSSDSSSNSSGCGGGGCGGCGG